MLFSLIAHIPSVKLFIASFLAGLVAKNASVTSSDPSRIIKCTTISALNTIVHVESRKRFVKTLKTSATPCSPVWVDMRICSMYLDFGAASCFGSVNETDGGADRTYHLDLGCTLDGLFPARRHGSSSKNNASDPGTIEENIFAEASQHSASRASC